MPGIDGFSPLVLALLTITESFPRFIQKGTLVVLAIQGFDPLVLQRSIQGISKAHSPKALEAALPSPVIIGLKMFSLAPNLRTQEGLVIRMPKPFLYKDSHHAPWKYDVTLISTRTGKEEICSNVSSSLAKLIRSRQCYTPGVIDNGSALNFCLMATLEHLKMDIFLIKPSTMIIRAFNDTCLEMEGEIELMIEIDPRSFMVNF